MSKHIDIAGQPILVGSLIAYAALWSRSATLKYGRVTRLEEREPSSWGNGQPIPTVRAVSVDRSFGDKWELQNKGREVSLGFVDRMLVVNGGQVPEEAFRLLHEGGEP
jgi:hypothetical protein